jgi:hypothetical protein
MMGIVWARDSPTTRRILAYDVHRFILIGYRDQALWAVVVPTWLSSRAFGDPPAQGFRGRRRLCVISAPLVPYLRTISGPLQISTMGHYTANSALRRQ